MTDRQQRALAALIRCSSTKDAAADAGIAYSTLRGWLKSDQAFREAYQAELAQLVEEASRSARAGMGEAVDTLRRISKDPDAPISAQVSASKALLDSGSRIIEIGDILMRLEALENAERD